MTARYCFSETKGRFSNFNHVFYGETNAFAHKTAGLHAPVRCCRHAKASSTMAPPRSSRARLLRLSSREQYGSRKVKRWSSIARLETGREHADLKLGLPESPNSDRTVPLIYMLKMQCKQQAGLKGEVASLLMKRLLMVAHYLMLLHTDQDG